MTTANINRRARYLAAVFFVMPLVCSADSIAQKYDQLYNPLPDNQLFCPTAICDLTQLFVYIIGDILRLIPIFSVFFLIVGGYKMIMSQGNEEKLLNAKRTIYWAVVELIIALLSFSIVAIEKNFLYGVI